MNLDKFLKMFGVIRMSEMERQLDEVRNELCKIQIEMVRDELVREQVEMFKRYYSDVLQKFEDKK